MALLRLSYASDFLTNISRASQAATSSFGEMQCTRYAAAYQNRVESIHVTSIRRYPEPPILPLPTNVSEIFGNETGRFTPERARDIAAPVLLYGNTCTADTLFSGQTKLTVDLSNFPLIREDTHVDSYDCFGAVSLNGSMQSNVPKPFSSRGKSTHLNMPGGLWARDGKYIAEDMQKSHYRTFRLPQLKYNKNGIAENIVISSSLPQIMYRPGCVFSMGYSTHAPEQLKNNESVDNKDKSNEQPSMRQKLKRAVKDYGSTVVVFHIGISLISLGAFYTAVVSGVDLMPIVKYITGGNEQLDRIMNTSSNFILAYTVHKLFAPARIYTTLAVTPLLVRYLRRIGFLKSPKVKTKQ